MTMLTKFQVILKDFYMCWNAFATNCTLALNISVFLRTFSDLSQILSI